MYRFVKLYVFFILISSFASAQNPGDSVFAGTKIHTINIQFSQTDYWDSLLYYYNLGTEQCIVAAVTFDGVLYDSVGVRFKGNSSFSHPNNKKSFKISFSEYRSSQKLDGLKSIHLNNGWGDPTFMREKVHLDFCRDAGIPAPRANYASLSLNGELWGFYSLVESVDKRFLSNHYDSNSGNLYKAVDAYGTVNYVSDFLWYGADTANYTPRYEFKTDGATNPWTDIIALIDTLNNSTTLSTSLPKVANLKSLYRGIATDILFGNLDSYVGSGRNFYIYDLPTTNRFNWIVWDVGLSMGAYPNSPSGIETLSLTYTIDAAQRPLVSKIFTTPALKNDYLYNLCSIYNTWFSLSRLSPKIDTLASIIRSYVYADPRKQYTSAQFETNMISDITASGTGTRIPGLKSFINLRQSSVKKQLASLGVTCDATIGVGEVVINEFLAKNDSIAAPDGLTEDWIELYNNTSTAIDLTGAYLSNDAANPSKWTFPSGTSIAANSYLVIWADQDSINSGIHASFKLAESGGKLILSAKDLTVLDSISFSEQKSNVSMARVPDGTGTFLQTTPSLGTTNIAPVKISQGEVVINEFAADNTAIANPLGKFEDWIEIYNNAKRTIDLSGIYLSDSFTKPTKWYFPSGTSITPNSWLVIWADEDTSTNGLHAAIKLSKSGEQIVLSNKDLTIIDSVTFGAQTTNKTMARIPNGTGPFVLSNPTIGYNNDSLTTVSDSRTGIPSSFALEQNYPNPFNPTTTIRYTLPSSAHVVLRVYDVLGCVVRTLVNDTQPAGYQSVVWNGLNDAGMQVPSSFYIYRLEAGPVVITKKMVLIK